MNRPAQMINLSGRIALVTGASRGIGRAVAECLAAAGATVAVNARSDEPGLSKICGYLRKDYQVEAAPFVADISDASAVSAMMQAVFKRYGRLDILVNNAGILRPGVIGMTKADDIDQLMRVNASGTLFCLQAGARLMSRSGGSIVNLASIMGLRGDVGMFAYSASKGAIVAATRAAAKELATKGIRVNAVAPGYIETDMAIASPEVRDRRIASISMGRIGTPEEVADAVLFLASDMSRYVTGQVLGVDGGMIV